MTNTQSNPQEAKHIKTHNSLLLIQLIKHNFRLYYLLSSSAKQNHKNFPNKKTWYNSPTNEGPSPRKHRSQHPGKLACQISPKIQVCF